MNEKKPMLSAGDALDFLLSAVDPITETQVLPTLEANGRVLAAPQVSRLAVPPMDKRALRIQRGRAEL